MPVQTPKKESGDNQLGSWLLFIALNCVALPFSAYQTYLGYQVDLGTVVGGAVAVLTTVFFIAVNYEIARRRREGLGIVAPMVLYLLPLAFSFPGNFGAFYEQFAGKDVLELSWDANHKTARSNMSLAMDAVVNCARPGRVAQYEAEKAKLINQYNNPANPYFGPKCRQHWSAMAKALGMSAFTAMPGNKLDAYLAAGDAHLQRFKEKIVADKTPCLKSEAAALQGILDAQSGFDLALHSNRQIGQKLNSLSLSNNALVDCASTYIEGAGCSSQLDDLGVTVNTSGMQWAFQSAYVKVDDPVNSILATVLALVIDLGVLLFILILFKPEVRGRLTGR